MIFKVLTLDEVVQLKDELQHDLPGSAKVRNNLHQLNVSFSINLSIIHYIMVCLLL